MSEHDATLLNDPDVDPQTDERDDQVIGRALSWSLIVIVVLCSIALGSVYFYTHRMTAQLTQETKIIGARTRDYPPLKTPQIPFVNITQPAGISFVYENGAAGEKLLPEMVGGGCAFLDFDNDGFQDLLLVNSCRWPWDAQRQEQLATSALYHNNKDGTFTDVTAGSGLDVSLYGMGVAVGDYDNDGLVDVFLPAVGPDRLFRNIGGGKFVDVTQTAAVAGDSDAWGTSAGFFDYNNDGFLDLFVCNYVAWTREFDIAQDFQATGIGRSYGKPQAFEGAFSFLYRNNGDGTFTDVSEQAGIQVRNPVSDVPQGKALAVTFWDFDNDGWMDVLVANDTVQNYLFHNLGDGTFEETGELAGVAFDFDGTARASMGIDIAHFRNNDAVGIAIANYANLMNALLVCNDNAMHFTDEAIASGLGIDSLRELKFGAFFIDCDLDGRLDFLTANGHVFDHINRIQTDQTFEQPAVLSWNCGPEHPTEFRRVGEKECGPDLFHPVVGRGASFADIDNDGDLDLLIATLQGSPMLLRNDQQLGNHWLRFKLTGTHCNRDAIGAMVEVHLDDRILRRMVMPTRSYLSQTELPVTFGLGPVNQVRGAVVRWPDGTQQHLGNVQLDRQYDIRQSAEAAFPGSHVQVSSDDG